MFDFLLELILYVSNLSILQVYTHGSWQCCFQSQNFQLAGEGNSNFSSGLQPLALPKLAAGPIAMGGVVVCAHVVRPHALLVAGRR
jgi:hypothetical protein